MEPLERVAVLLTLMRELEGVMRQENALLREMRLGRLADLQAEKAALAEAYEIELRALRRAPEVMASLPAHARASLEQATREFQLTARSNVNALLAGRAVVEGIVRRIGDSLATVRPGRGGYAGAVRPVADAGSARVIAVAFDRRI
jgi:hypothetical protein